MNIKFLMAATALTLVTACNNSPAAPEAAAPDAETAMPADEMAPAAATGDIVATAQGNADFSTLVTAVTAAELGATLSGPGPFTVFAPTNAAFAKVDPTTLENLLKPEQKAALAKILTYHVVAGKMTAADLTKAITDGGGTAELTTVEGGKLKATVSGDKVILEDAKGGKSTVTITDVDATNGVIHAIDAVVMPG